MFDGLSISTSVVQGKFGNLRRRRRLSDAAKSDFFIGQPETAFPPKRTLHASARTIAVRSIPYPDAFAREWV
jgi:hypothetical protein